MDLCFFASGGPLGFSLRPLCISVSSALADCFQRIINAEDTEIRREHRERFEITALLLVILLNVFPVPGLVKVGAKTEALGIAHEPFVGGSVYLDCAI